MVLCLCTVLCVVNLNAKASSPSLQVETGTPYFYSVAKKNPASVTYGTATGTASQMTVSKSGNTISINETASNKLYELGYVPIITSMTVPAESSIYITLTFSLTGKKNGSGSAVETMELLDFGSYDKSSSLTFKTESNTSDSYTKARASNRNSEMSTSYTVTVEYKNTDKTKKAVSRYFGFFVGVHYGSTKNHKLETSCTVTAGSVATGSVASGITFNHDDARTISVGYAKKATYPKSDFVPDVSWDSLTTEQRRFASSVSNSTSTKDTWYSNRLSVEQTSKTELRIFSNGTPSNTGLKRLAYTPFTVPITVPAYTTRTYYLTFEIAYERNASSSEAGFFAELIEGEAPDDFNTDTSGTMTGNTKLRVYSEGGSGTHSGRVEIPVKLTNNTASAKTFEQNYVFFAGHRNVGLYTPTPAFRLKLQDITYNTYDDVYTITAYGRNCSVTFWKTTSGFTDVNAAVAPDTGYSLPTSVTVTVGGTTLAASKYTYNKSNGRITIPMDYVKGAIHISCLAVPNKYSITYSGLEGATLSVKPTIHTYGTKTTVGNPTKDGYTFEGWKINNGTAINKDLKLGATAYTSDIKLTATWKRSVCKVTLNPRGGTVNPTSVTVTIGGTYGELPVPTMEGAGFGGWYTERNGRGTEIFSTTKVTAEGDHTLYARWVYAPNPNWGKDEVIKYGQRSPAGFYGCQVDSDYEWLFEWYRCDDRDRTNAVKAASASLNQAKFRTPADLPVGEYYYYATVTRIEEDGKSGTAVGPVVKVTVVPATPVYYESPDTIDIWLDKDNRTARLGDYNITGGCMKNKDSGALVTGTFSWTESDRIFTGSDASNGDDDYQSLYVHFIPNDLVNYEPTDVNIPFVRVKCKHNYIDTGEIVTAPTCTEDGEMRQQCDICGDRVLRKIPAAHDYENGTWMTNETEHWKKCANCESTDTPADHIFGDWSGGKRICEVCGYEERQVITVTITWGDMAFTYKDGDWDPETHSYGAGEWTADDPNGNLIIVDNGGDVEVSVIFVYDKVAGSDAEGTFEDERGAVIDAPAALPAGETKRIRLLLTGRPEKYMESETVGTVTVRLGGAE